MGKKVSNCPFVGRRPLALVRLLRSCQGPPSPPALRTAATCPLLQAPPGLVPAQSARRAQRLTRAPARAGAGLGRLASLASDTQVPARVSSQQRLACRVGWAVGRSVAAAWRRAPRMECTWPPPVDRPSLSSPWFESAHLPPGALGLRGGEHPPHGNLQEPWGCSPGRIPPGSPGQAPWQGTQAVGPWAPACT